MNESDEAELFLTPIKTAPGRLLAARFSALCPHNYCRIEYTLAESALLNTPPASRLHFALVFINLVS